jgi:hypothetical protein
MAINYWKLIHFLATKLKQGIEAVYILARKLNELVERGDPSVRLVNVHGKGYKLQ